MFDRDIIKFTRSAQPTGALAPEAEIRVGNNVVWKAADGLDALAYVCAFLPQIAGQGEVRSCKYTQPVGGSIMQREITEITYSFETGVIKMTGVPSMTVTVEKNLNSSDGQQALVAPVLVFYWDESYEKVGAGPW